MNRRRRFDVIEYLFEAELDTTISEAQKADEARLVRRLRFVKNLYAGDVLEEAARRISVSQDSSSRWAHGWNDAGVDGLRPSFGGGRPPKLSDEQFAELCEVLEEGQPWTSRAIHTLIEDRYGVTYDPAHLSRKLRGCIVRLGTNLPDEDPLNGSTDDDGPDIAGIEERALDPWQRELSI